MTIFGYSLNPPPTYNTAYFYYSAQFLLPKIIYEMISSRASKTRIMQTLPKPSYLDDSH